MSNDFGIQYNEGQVQDAIALFQDIQNDLIDVDYLLYRAVMDIAYAKGFSFLEQDDSSINMRMPEKLMVQCREDTKKLYDQMVDSAEKIKSLDTPTQDSAAIPKTIAASSAVAIAAGAQTLNGMPKIIDVKTVREREVQVLYGVKKPDIVQTVEAEPVQQVLYGARPTPEVHMVEEPERVEQVLYGVRSSDDVLTGDEETVVVEENRQVLYGARPAPEAHPVEGRVEQVLYGVKADDDLQVGYEEDRQLLYGPPPVEPEPEIHAIEDSGRVEQVLYGPRPAPEVHPVETTEPVQQVLYGVKADDDLQYSFEEDRQLLYGPPPTEPAPAPQYREETSGIDEHSITTPTNPTVVTTPPATTEYAPIPDTGVGGKMGIEDYITPALVGVISGAAGIGLTKNIHKEIDEDEESDEEDTEK